MQHPFTAGQLKKDALALGGGFALLFVLSAGATFVNGAPRDRGPVQQPVVFNHAKHVDEEGLECSACHAHYASETYSGMPGVQFCALCHLEPQGESPDELRLAEMLQQGVPLTWEPLFAQPPHVFFSHRRHVVVAEIECATCHGDIGHSAAPPTVRNPLSMAQCLDCHEEREASLDCSACHR